MAWCTVALQHFWTGCVTLHAHTFHALPLAAYSNVSDAVGLGGSPGTEQTVGAGFDGAVVVSHLEFGRHANLLP